MEQCTNRFMIVSCIECYLDVKCRSCCAWQYFLYFPRTTTFIDLKNNYMDNFETDMIILKKQFYILYEDRASDILTRIGLKELFDNYSEIDKDEATRL